MRYFSYFNRTYSEIDGTWEVFRAIIILDVVLHIICLMCLTLMLYLHVRTPESHRNLRIILYVYACTFYPYAASRLVQGVLVLKPVTEGAPYHHSLLFMSSSWVRTFSGIAALGFLLGIVVERGCATYLLSDYEGKKRVYIPIIITQVILLVSTISTYSFHYVESTIPVAVGFVLCNVLAVLGNILIRRVNHKYYANQQLHGHYTLAERYQISENIRMSNVLQHVFRLIAVQNLLCAIAISVNSFHIEDGCKNVVVEGFNFGALIYAMSVPFVMLYHKKTLRKELERLFEKLGIRKLKKAYVSDISKLQLKTTLGKDMIVDKSDQSKTYFKLLNRDWA
ncbi:hypothetical protein Q1695_011398 [Nippostrongylus brasiliensis]|nr:hypothetical protein Q1695_011398 [Nippostrongylus brasiliensis]